ncbi:MULTISPECIES: flagellar hook-associated protein FlgK [unclassified Nitrobacter]|uniref:flagellar hook-associated protein FlgK n=1 Tax=unclassified Nitrobacter TaxID=2620411 RepID=UPI0009272DEE|nr:MULTISPECIES: flagellar hook-associated protein FlgK [unclassified Nitrobacter]MBN9148286.1 flagellar hook-associated protein FlgK [Nitrobacter sp.]OJV01300.1 MAG: flagellar hook-associated protein FlgK [Nitrobacter sp. 62-23]
MSLSSALSIAMSGLRANQAALSIVSGNVANANTPGYVAQTLIQHQTATGDTGSGVRVIGVERSLDTYVQSQLRTENAGGAYADQVANVLGQLQNVYGTPGNDGTLEAAYNRFTSALQALSASSGNTAAQSSVLNAAQALAQQLNATTNGIQTLRSNAEQDLSMSVSQANAAMQQITQLNQKLQSLSTHDPAAATLMDQRDAAIDRLSKLMDIRAVTDGANQTSVFTTSGIQLVGGVQASTLTFNAQSSLTANSQWNADPSKSSVGTIICQLPNGAKIDMIASQGINSGQIAADVQLRDKTLVQAQNQVDQMAATLASALSDVTTGGTPAAGPPSNYTSDLSNVLPGNSLNITYTDSSNVSHTITVVRVDDAGARPIPNTASNPNDQVIGIDFSGGAASVATQLSAALGSSRLTFSASGSSLTVTSSGLATVNETSTTTTTPSLASGNPQLPFFTDRASLYTGAITGTASQITGLAGRIQVNAALLADPSKLTVYTTSPMTPAGDTTRSDFLFDQLTSATFSYAPNTGLGSTAAPFTGTLPSFLQQFVSVQSNAATTAKQVAQGQDIVVNTLQEKFNARAGVNIDTEMTNLIALQNSYAANAHVMSVVQSMMQTLLQAQL